MREGLRFEETMNFQELFFFFFFFFLCLGSDSLIASTALGKVVLISRNATLSFDDIEASFGELVLSLLPLSDFGISVPGL